MNKFVKLSRILRNKDYIRALMLGVAAGVENEQFLSQIGSFRSIIDIGANRGQFALVARHAFPEAIIHSCEPLVEPAKKYAEIFKADKNAYIYRYAIGRTKKSMNINISKSDDSSSLLPIGYWQLKFAPDSLKVGTAKVKVVRLQELIDIGSLPSPRLLKIDVQGFEFEVIIGALDILSSFQLIIVECSLIPFYPGQMLAKEIIETLTKHEFSLASIYNPEIREGKIVQADFVFTNNAR